MGWKRRLAMDLAYLCAAAVACGAVWTAIYTQDAHLLVSTASGLQTLFQVIATAIVGIFAVFLASVFLVAQQVVTHFGQRSVIVLLLERSVRFMLATALLLAMTTLLISGQVPSDPAADPEKAVAATAGTLAICSAAYVFLSTIALGSLFQWYTSASRFVKRYVGGAGRHGLSETHVKVLRQALRTAARRGDGGDMRAILDGISELIEQHLSRPQRFADPRADDPDRARASVACTAQAARGLVRGGEEAMRSGAHWSDLDRFMSTLTRAAEYARLTGRIDEAMVFADALAQLTAFGQQLGADDPLRAKWLPRGATELATLEAASESRPEFSRLATRALADWALVTAGVDGEDWRDGPLYAAGRPHLGRLPPYEEALAVVDEIAEGLPWALSPADRPELARRGKDVLRAAAHVDTAASRRTVEAPREGGPARGAVRAPDDGAGAGATGGARSSALAGD